MSPNIIPLAPEWAGKLPESEQEKKWICNAKAITTQAEADRVIPELLAFGDGDTRRALVLSPLAEIEIDNYLEIACGFCGAAQSDEGVCHTETPNHYACNAGCDQSAHSNSRIREKLDWLIIQGLEGPESQPMHPSHVESLVKQAEAAGCPVCLNWGDWCQAGQNQSKMKGRAKRWPVFHEFSDETRVFRIGAENSGSMLDGREIQQIPGVEV